MNHSESNSRELSSHILSVSATMIGVCVTIVTLFQVASLHSKTYADELLGFDTLIFIFACFLSYGSIRSRNSKIELLADKIFLLGLSVLVLSGFLILRVR